VEANWLAFKYCRTDRRPEALSEISKRSVTYFNQNLKSKNMTIIKALKYIRKNVIDKLWYKTGM
jgi:hypothetical protein